MSPYRTFKRHINAVEERVERFVLWERVSRFRPIRIVLRVCVRFHCRILLFAVLCSLCSPQTAPTLERTPSGVIRVGLFQFQPLNFIDDNGVAQGLNVDLLREIVRDENWTIQFVPGSWEECLERLQNEEIDLMMSVAFSTDRHKVMDYSYEPVAEIWGQVFFRPESGITSMDDLTGRTVAVMRRDINADNFLTTSRQLGISTSFLKVSSHQDVFAAVQKGEADAGVAPQHFGLRHAKQYDLVASSIIFSPFPIFFATKKGVHHDVLSHIDYHLSGWKNDKESFYYDRLNYWLGSGETTPKVLLRYLYTIVLSALVVISLMALWLTTLKRLVAVRTRELHISLEKYRVIFENFPMGISIIGDSGDILEVNKASAELLGIQSDEHRSRTIDSEAWTIVDQNGTPLTSEQYPAAIALREKQTVCDQVIGVARPDSRTVWLSVTASPIPLEGFGVAVCYSDISEKMEAEHRRQVSERKYREIFENAPVGIFLADDKVNIFDANDRASKITGFSHEELCTFNARDIIHQTSLEERPPEQVARQALAHGVTIYERRLNSKNGAPVPVEASLFVSPTTGTYTVIFQDISLRKEAEERIRKHQEELERMVGVRTAELREEIRERQMAEQALNDSKQRFQDIVETVSDWFWEMDQEFRFCYLSDTFFKATNLNREDVIGKTRWELASQESLDEDPEGWQQHKDDLNNHRRVHDFEYSTRSLDGSKRYLRVNGKAIFSGSGDFVGYRGATTDVTEQKTIELALLQSEERFRDIAEAASDWFWETDAEHRFTFLSGRYQQATGIHTSHVLGSTRLEFLEKYAIFSRRDAIAKHKKDLSEHKPFALAYRVTNREGGFSHVRINGKPIFDFQGKFIGYRGAGSDVTRIVIAGMALRASEERFRQIVEGVGEEYCFYSLDARGRFSFHSPSILRWFDLPGAGLKGLSWEWVTALDAASKLKLREATTVCIQGERPAPFMIRSIERYGCKTYEISQRPVHSEVGRVIGVDGIVRDISVQVQSEEALKRAKEQAEKAAEAKSEFLANMSHEIRTPLNAVTGFSELLSTMVTDSNQRQYLDAIKTAGNSLLTLINDILDLSKIEANMLTMNYQPVSLRDLLGEIEQIFRAKVNSKNIAFSMVIDPQLPEMLIIDEVRVRQVLLNLVGNSVKFTDKGYIEVSVRLNHCDKNGHLLDMSLTVRDSGIGIEEASIQSIFEPFRQNEIPDTRKYGGTGLGLAICRRLVEAMDGEISATSEVGTGTLLEVRLHNVGFIPSGSQPERETEQRVTSDIRFYGASVLVVDDIDSNISLLTEILTLHNLNAITAVNGQEALERLAENTVDLIIMDIRMPVMDGITASQRIRENPSTRHIPIIALTASTLPEEREAIMSKGFDGYLTKPIKITTLIAELTSYLEHSTSQASLSDDVEESAPLQRDLIYSPDLRLHLEQHMLPLCRSISTTLLIDEVMDFAKALQGLGTAFANDSLAAFGKELEENVQAFDIAAIREKLEEFQTSIIPETKEG